jgi:hypothetical protein
VDAFPLSEALAAGDNIGYPWSSLPQDIQIVILTCFHSFSIDSFLYQISVSRFVAEFFRRL